MKVTVNSKKGLKTELKIFVNKETINTKIQSKLNELKNQVNMKGFRPGKVPIDVLKRQFGKAVYGEVLENVLRDTTENAIKEKKIRVAGQPKIDIKNHGENKDLEYLVHIDKLPEIETNQIKKIKIINYEVTVSKEEVEKRLIEIAKNQKNFVDKKDAEISETGDLVVFDYKATIDGKGFEGNEGKNTQLVLGQDLFLKGFDKQLIGNKKNSEIIIDAKLPENYPKKELSNKLAKFSCKILNIKKPEKIEINDNLAKNFGATNIVDLKNKITDQMKKEFNNTLNNLTKKEILDQIENFKNFEIPETLVEQEISIISKGQKKEDIDKNKLKNEKIAKNRIKVGLVLNEFGEKNNLKVSEEELNQEIAKQIRMMPDQAKQVMEYYKKNPGAASSLKGGIYEDKIISLIKKEAKSVKKTLTIQEAEKLILGETKNIQKNPDSNKSSKVKKTAKINKKTKKVSKK